MALGTKHTLAAVSASGTLITGISQQAINFAIQSSQIVSDGNVYPTFSSTLRQAPMCSFTSSQIAVALGVAGLNGLKITTGAVLALYLQKVAQGGTRETGTNHEKVTMTEGLLVPTAIRAGLAEYATIDYSAYARYDGTNDPLILASSQALAGTAAPATGFVAGPVSINGTAIGGIQSIAIEPGIQVEVEYADDPEGQWPCFISIGEIRPRIRITTLDKTALDTLGLEGVAQGLTDSLVYLRGCENLNKRYANASTQHIKFAIDDGKIWIEDNQAQHPGANAHSIVIEPNYDGTNAIVAVTTGVAIT